MRARPSPYIALMRSGLLPVDARRCAVIAVATVLGAGGDRPRARRVVTLRRRRRSREAGVLVRRRLPRGLRPPNRSPGTSHAEQHPPWRRASSGCAPYITLQKAHHHRPAGSLRRVHRHDPGVGNEVDVFRSDRAASELLGPVREAEHRRLPEEAVREAPCCRIPTSRGRSSPPPSTSSARTSPVSVTTASSTRAQVVLTGTDGSTASLGIGNAAVRVGRAVELGHVPARRAATSPTSSRPRSTPRSGACAAALAGCRSVRSDASCRRVLVASLVRRRGARGGRHVGRPAARRDGRAAAVRLPVGLDSRARAGPPPTPSLDAEAAEIPNCKPFTAFSTAEQEEPAREVAELRPRAVQRRQHRERLPDDGRGGGRGPHVLGCPKLPRCLEQLFDAVYERRAAEETRRPPSSCSR